MRLNRNTLLYQHQGQQPTNYQVKNYNGPPQYPENSVESVFI